MILDSIYGVDAVQKVHDELPEQSTGKSQRKTTEQESRTKLLKVDNPSDTTVRKQREFSYQELVKATRNFREDAFLGEGGFGQVYKGKLENPHQVINFLHVSTFDLYVLTFDVVMKWSGCCRQKTKS